MDLCGEWHVTFANAATKLVQEQKMLLLAICDAFTNCCKFKPLKEKFFMCGTQIGYNLVLQAPTI